MLVLGVILITLSSLSSAVGLVLMKASAELESHLPPLQRRQWFMGFFFLGVNATALNLLAYSVIPLALVAPFSGLTVVFVALLLHSGLLTEKEEIDWKSGAAISAVCAGVAAITALGPHSSVALSEEASLEVFFNPFFGLFVSMSAAAVGSLLALRAAQASAPKRLKLGENATVPLLAYAAASCGALVQLFFKVLATTLATSLTDTHSSSATRFAHLARPHALLSFGGLSVFAPVQLALLSSLLSHGSGTYAVATYQVLLIVLTIVVGAAFFRELGAFSELRLCCFTAGVALAVGGLAPLSSKRSATSSCEERDCETTKLLP